MKMKFLKPKSSQAGNGQLVMTRNDFPSRQHETPKMTQQTPKNCFSLTIVIINMHRASLHNGNLALDLQILEHPEGPLLTHRRLCNTILHRLPSFFLGLPVYLVSTARQDKGLSLIFVFAFYFAFRNQ